MRSHRRIVSILALLLPCVVAPTSAATLEMPMTDLIGAYGPAFYGANRAASVQLPANVAVVHSVSLRYAGTTPAGIADCLDYGGITPWWTDLYVELLSSPSYFGYVQRLCPPDGETFAVTDAFSLHSSDGTWDFLREGGAELRIFIGPGGGILECLPENPWPASTLTEVTLVLDVEFAVPAATATWGRIKALYR